MSVLSGPADGNTSRRDEGDMRTAERTIKQLRARYVALRVVDQDGLALPVAIPGAGYIWALRS